MSINRRTNPRHRITLDVTVRVGAGGKEYYGQSVDLSRSGIFVQLRDPIPEGRRVDLVVSPGKGHELLVTSGLVVHTLKGYGIGVKFSSQTERTRQMIDILLEKMHPGALASSA